MKLKVGVMRSARNIELKGTGGLLYMPRSGGRGVEVGELGCRVFLPSDTSR